MDASSSTVMESPSAHPDDHSRRPLLTLEQSAGLRDPEGNRLMVVQ
jgi:hypothetical protein